MTRERCNGKIFSILVLVSAGLWLMYTLNAQAAAPDRGRALYDNQCRTCHEDWAHSRTSRKAKSLMDLRSRTMAWSTHSGLEWSEEEVNDVVDYLNKHFYHFE